jgi:hypothetical protein
MKIKPRQRGTTAQAMESEMRQSQNDEAGKLFGKEQRARDIASALEAYAAERRAVDENTARLRALRLARDAAAKDENAKPAKKPAKRAKRINV